MGERKGQNLYYPPDYDPRAGGLNKWQGTHALRERARKLHLGILIIRFEMPFNIWCEGCGNHVGMGVRYNAEKTKVGMYYTTPVYRFRMKCHLCDNHYEIETDPGNLEYKIISGARRQENRWDPTDNGQVVPEDRETQHRLVDDAMFKLEHGSSDKATAAERAPRLAALMQRNAGVWDDHYAANCALRQRFRKRRNELETAAKQDEALSNKYSLNIQLLEENSDDRANAKDLASAVSACPTARPQLKRARVSLPARLDRGKLGVKILSHVPGAGKSATSDESSLRDVSSAMTVKEQNVTNSELSGGALLLEAGKGITSEKGATSASLTTVKEQNILPSELDEGASLLQDGKETTSENAVTSASDANDGISSPAHEVDHSANSESAVPPCTSRGEASFAPGNEIPFAPVLVSSLVGDYGSSSSDDDYR